MIFWIAICGVVGFFLPIWPGGVAFVIIASVLNGALGWARAVQHQQSLGREVVGAGAAFLLVMPVAFAMTGIGYLLGRGLGALVGIDME